MSISQALPRLQRVMQAPIGLNQTTYLENARSQSAKKAEQIRRSNAKIALASRIRADQNRARMSTD